MGPHDVSRNRLGLGASSGPTSENRNARFEVRPGFRWPRPARESAAGCRGQPDRERPGDRRDSSRLWSPTALRPRDRDHPTGLTGAGNEPTGPSSAWATLTWTRGGMTHLSTARSGCSGRPRGAADGTYQSRSRHRRAGSCALGPLRSLDALRHVCAWTAATDALGVRTTTRRVGGLRVDWRARPTGESWAFSPCAPDIAATHWVGAEREWVRGGARWAQSDSIASDRSGRRGRQLYEAMTVAAQGQPQARAGHR